MLVKPSTLTVLWPCSRQKCVCKVYFHQNLVLMYFEIIILCWCLKKLLLLFSTVVEQENLANSKSMSFWQSAFNLRSIYGFCDRSEYKVTLYSFNPQYEHIMHALLNRGWHRGQGSPYIVLLYPFEVSEGCPCGYHAQVVGNINRPFLFLKPRLRLQIRLRLAWPRGCVDKLCVLCIRVQGFRRVNGAW